MQTKDFLKVVKNIIIQFVNNCLSASTHNYILIFLYEQVTQWRKLQQEITSENPLVHLSVRCALFSTAEFKPKCDLTSINSHCNCRRCNHRRHHCHRHCCCCCLLRLCLLLRHCFCLHLLILLLLLLLLL